MLTSKALLGIAHFLMQADPITAQQVLNELQPQDSQQIIQIIQSENMDGSVIPVNFREKISEGTVEADSPSHETGAPGL